VIKPRHDAAQEGENLPRIAGRLVLDCMNSTVAVPEERVNGVGNGF
jgi:hypothetical protein